MENRFPHITPQEEIEPYDERDQTAGVYMIFFVGVLWCSLFAVGGAVALAVWLP